jgi:hypothetical protein
MGNDGWTEFAFGAVNAAAQLEYGRNGSAELQDDSPVEIELSLHNGDAAILTARRK